MSDILILASGSPFRRQLMENAGLDFLAIPAEIDERAVEQPLVDAGASPEDIALVLAEAKATEVSERRPGALVIGSDQTLSLDDEVLHKVANMEGARRRLMELSGRTHHLNSAIAIVRNGETLWRHVSVASLTMRQLQGAEIGRHLSQAGDGVLSSVGAYQIEGLGIRLFDRIEGDTFTIIGLPMLPLLAELRRLGVIHD
ncbi:MAG: Maf-like protein [Notoacmeibacter sp.]|nr:Maf-like protein [Notoacmeibacter sp.]MCC0033520.1 Maf-like protein [Brucellaceae bacterium]